MDETEKQKWNIKTEEIIEDPDHVFKPFFKKDSFLECNTEDIYGPPFKNELQSIMYNDNNYLVRGYRKTPSNSYLDCFKSAFSIHNETINIWTHFLGFFFSK
jgi:hypothetical protein